jgi:bacterioferritin
MRGEPEIIELLNEVLTSELTAINQYFVHYRMLENFGYPRLAKKKREESIEEMHHADEVIERILFLEGVPNMQRLSPVRVGEEPVEMHKLDLALEQEAQARLNRGIALAVAKGDNGETQLSLVESICRERYLAENIEGH